MGCGKSTVGRRLAERLQMTFVDMDAYIERQAGCTVSDIFRDMGEAGFRKLEHDACCTLGSDSGLVIATGGGAVMRDDNVEALKANGTIVLLEVSVDCVLSRLKNDTTRPLLRQPDKRRAATELLEARIPFYLAAADIVVNGEADADTVVTAILSRL